MGGDPEDKQFVKTLVAIGAIGIVVAAVKAVLEARNRAKEKARAKSEAQDKGHAAAHFALAINYLTQGDTESAFREYQIVEELDENLAGELYDRIFG